ncbi:MAG: hypothetical protein U9Q71_05435, partial [Pseudomonadota bacterium]|nr:hypothetical protein [Pseudomonadota bacterium]
MNRHVASLKWPALVLTLIWLAGCASSTKLVNSWNDPAFSGADYKRILVLGVMDDDLQRRAYEDAFVERISGKDGVVGIAGYTLMPDPDSYDEEHEVRAAVEQAGADAALLATLVGVKQQERYVPPRVDYMPSYGMGYGFYDYYGMSYQSVYRPGYMTTDTVVKLETTVFDTASEKMV